MSRKISKKAKQKGADNRRHFLASAITFALFAGCIECDPAFDIPVPTSGYNKSLTLQLGGIANLFLLNSNTPFTDQTDAAEWAAKITAGELYMLNSCAGEAGIEANSNTEDLGACQGTYSKFIRNTLTFNSIMDNTNRDRWKLFNAMQSNPACFVVAARSCSGDVLPFTAVSIIATKSVEPTKTGYTRWVLTMTWDEKISPLPLVLAFDPTALFA